MSKDRRIATHPCCARGHFADAFLFAFGGLLLQFHHMANRYYAAAERRAERVNDLQSFGPHRLWKRRLKSLAGVVLGIYNYF